MRILTLLAAAAGAAGLPAQGRSELLIQGAVGGVHWDQRGECGEWVLADAPAGETTLHFGADGRLKPVSLSLSLQDGAAVHVRVEHAAGDVPAAFTSDLHGEKIATFSDVDKRWHGDGDGAHCEPGEADAVVLAPVHTLVPMRTMRAQVEVRHDGGGAVGVAVRCEGGDCYRFEWDREQAEVRLVRQFGGQQLVVKRAALRSPPGDWHRLALQADGFELAAWFDDDLVLQAMDGALISGGAGLFAGARATSVFRDFVLGEPVGPGDVFAVQSAGWQSEIVARAPRHAGMQYLLCAWCERPRPATLGALGEEPFLMLRPSFDLLFLGGLAGLRATGLRGTLGPRGELHASITWPELSVLRGRAMQCGALVVENGGERVLHRLPTARVRW